MLSIQEKYKIFSNLVDIYEEELSKSPRDRLLRLSRESIRKQIEMIKENIPKLGTNANIKQKLPHIISVTFVGVDGESLMTKLDMNGIAVSMGSACTSNSLTVSHVISALGIQADNARSTLRFSFSTSNTFEEIDKAVAIIKQAVEELRAYSSTYSMKIRKRKGDKNV